MSRVRIIWNQGGTVFCGRRAIKQLNAMVSIHGVTVPPFFGQPQWKRAIEMEVALRKDRLVNPYDQLRIYREPRKVSEKKSKYKTTLRTLGVTLVLPRGTRRGATPQRYRPPAALPKQKRPSRIVSMLEQELLRNADGDF